MTRFLALLLVLCASAASAEPLGPERHLLELLNSERRVRGLLWILGNHPTYQTR